MDNKYTIALIDDEEGLKKTLGIALRAAGFTVMPYENASVASEIIKQNLPDLIILDILMPGIDGITFCSDFQKQHPDIPVIFLSSKVDELTKLEALQRGGDDYLTKPFSIKELIARINVCLRRKELYQSANKNKPAECYNYDEFNVNYSTWEIFINNMLLNLTVTEFRMFTTLLKNPGIVFTREQLMQTAYPEDAYVTDRNVDMHIVRIRKKISSLCPDFEKIETVYGLGYRYGKD